MSPPLVWAAHINAHLLPGEALVVVGELSSSLVTSPYALALAQFVDGVRSAEDVVEAAADSNPSLDLATCYSVLEDLLERGYLHEGGTPWDTKQLLAAEWGIRTATPPGIRSQVIDLARDDATATAVAHALKQAGVPAEVSTSSQLQTAEFPAVTLAVVVTDDYLDPRLPEFDAQFQHSKQPWLLARTVRSAAWVGPIFAPGETACWHCLKHRLEGNRELDVFLSRKTRTPVSAIRRAWPSSLVELTAGLVASTALGYMLAGDTRPTLKGTLTTFDVGSAETSRHIVIRRPQCPACGTPVALDQIHAPIVLPENASAEANDSGLRTVDPDETLSCFDVHVSPISGAVSGVVPVPLPGNDFMHVYAAGHNFAMRDDSFRYLRAGLRNKSSGKGFTKSQAQASAICEALERYQGLYTGDEPRRQGQLREFGSAGVHPNDVMLWSQAQYAARDEWNARDLKFAVVPEFFNDDQVCDWSSLWSLTEMRHVWLPTGMLYFAVPRPEGKLLFIACSNGSASGNTQSEAILQGMLELVERDAVAMWWYNRVRRPEIRVETVADSRVQQIADTYSDLGRSLRLLDLTNDLGIPVCAAVSSRRLGDSEDIVMGFGAHLNPNIAAIRAIAEVTQFLPAVADNPATGPATYAYEDAESQLWWRTATLSNQPHLVPDSGAVRTAAARASDTTDIGEATRSVKTAIEEAGSPVLVLDQTRPDIGLPTVKVVAPGMRHFWPRFAPGRLYDVPVRLRWLAEPTREQDLNPIVMFL